MAQLLVVILNNPEQVPEILSAWHEIGVPGATIFNTAGGYRTKNWLDQVGLSGLTQIFSAPGRQSKTLLSAIEDDTLLDKAIFELEKIIANFDKPHTGLYFTVPITMSKGIIDPSETPLVSVSPAKGTDMSEEAKLITRNSLVSTVNEILVLEPITVNKNDTLMQVAEAMVKQPAVHVACVVDEQKRLVGILSLRDLADDLFMDVVPEEFLSETRGLDAALHFADMSRTKTAADAMKAPVAVKESSTVKDAFHLMHKQQLSGIPVVSDRQEVTGYISLLELLALYAKSVKDSA